jgi:hypothetical protein
MAIEKRSLRVGYIDAERVYVFNSWLHPVHAEEYNYSECQVFKHRDIVKMLNNFLKRIEAIDNQDLTNNYAMALYGLISSFSSYDRIHFMPYKVMTEDTIIFDDEKKIIKKKLPRLNLPRCSAPPKNLLGLKFINGGKPSITY